ncbi:hypothetical protein Tco_0847599 [Tanacetum coccineum]
MDVMKKADPFAFNQMQNLGSFMLHTASSNALSTIIRNDIPAPSCKFTFGYVIYLLPILISADILLSDFNYKRQQQSQANCKEICTLQIRVGNTFNNNNGQVTFQATGRPRIGRRQKQHAKRIHRHISDVQPTSPPNRVPFEYAHLGKCTLSLWESVNFWSILATNCGAMFFG